MKIREVNGYTMVYAPGHPNAYTSKNWFGWVYLHVKVASEKLGRKIEKGENVHHLDGDKKNNNQENIQVLSNHEHGRLHAKISGKSCERKIVPCLNCGITIKIGAKSFCSYECLYEHLEKQRPSRQQIADDLTMLTVSAIARKYKVSFNAVKKWIKKYSLPYNHGDRKAFRINKNKIISHGTWSGYGSGCRCDICKSFRKTSEREYRAKKRELAQSRALHS